MKDVTVTYQDGLSDGRVVVKANGTPVGFYMQPNKSLTYMFFFDQGRQMQSFIQRGEMEWFAIEIYHGNTALA